MKAFPISQSGLQTMQRRNVLKAIAAGAAVAASPWSAHAQARWPAKPVSLIVPFPAGGGTDAFARPFSAQFAKATGTQLVIDNKGGAGGTLGAGSAGGDETRGSDQRRGARRA